MKSKIRMYLGVLMALSLMTCSAQRDAEGRPQRNLRFGIPLSKQEKLEPGAAKRYGPGEYVRTFNVGGRERFYEVHVPAAYKHGTATPVVMVFHGGGGHPTAIRWQSNMDDVSDRHGFIAVYPAGTGLFAGRLLTFNAGGGAVGYAAKNNIDDGAYVRALLDDLPQYFAVDKDRVYATGLSNGAQMCYRIACELSDRIAAIAPVGATLSLPNCSPSRPVSVIHFHGMADRNVPFGGGLGPAGKSGFSHKSVPDTLARWEQADGISPAPSKTWQTGQATFKQYGPGKEGSEIILVTLADGGHTWPGGDVATEQEGEIVGHVSKDINASELMWEFFQKHPRNPSSATGTPR